MSRTASPASASDAAPSKRVPFGGTAFAFGGEIFGGAIVSAILLRRFEQLRLRHKLRRESQNFPHRFERPRDDAFGQGVYSRVPFATEPRPFPPGGWSDPQISPANSTQYYARVIEALGGREAIDSDYRLFMAPGMGHCSGGDGPNTFDMLAALEAWVERKQAPDRVTASHATNDKIDRTRPLCPYPQVAVYTGTGSIDDAANFSCQRQRVQ